MKKKQKNRNDKEIEYTQKYSAIPRDYKERLEYMYKTLNINEKLENEILSEREYLMQNLKYQNIQIVLYEVPEPSPRPRFRIIQKSNVINMAIQNPNFVHVYSPVGESDRKFMQRLSTDELMFGLSGMIMTPCVVRYRTFFKTPSIYNRKEIFLAEMGLYRPISTPDWDNLGKKYSDMSNGTLWLDDSLVIDGSVGKYYSILPRIELDISFLNMLYNKKEYDKMLKRTNDPNINYFGGL